MDDINALQQKVMTLIRKGSWQQALDTLNKSRAKYGNTVKYDLMMVGVQIDYGSYIQDYKMVKKGIERGIKCIKIYREDDDAVAAFSYNVANGILFKISTKSANETYFDLDNDIKKCLDFFLKAEDARTDPNILTNLANLYDQIGRPIEALQYYNKALNINPRFGMAIGNKGVLINNLAILTTTPPLHKIYAYQCLQEAIANDGSVLQYGDPAALHHFENIANSIEHEFIANNSKDALNTSLEHPPRIISHNIELDKYTEFCLQNDLYLTLHIFDNYSNGSIGDNITPSFIVSHDDDQSRYRETIKMFDEVVESYITGRYLLWQSQWPTKTMSRISSQSVFLDNSDCIRHSIFTGMAKNSYKIAFSILDKIAQALNVYLQLGYNSKEIDYRKIWHDGLNPRNQVPDRLKNQNYLLYGLYSTVREISNLSNVRNAIEHRYYDISSTPDTEKLENTAFFEDFIGRTIGLYYKTKCAIIYLINFINATEKQKLSNRNTPACIIPVVPIPIQKIV